MRFLAVSTSTHRFADSGIHTGMWLSEYTHFYDVMAKAGHSVDLASIAGGSVPLDPVSLQSPYLLLGGTHKRYADPDFMEHLDTTPALADVDPEGYDGIYLIGGHGAMVDFDAEALKGALAWFTDHGRIVAAVCHGPAGLLDVPLADGTALLDGRKITGFTWAEEKLARRASQVPYSLEERLSAQAGEFAKARVPMAKHVIVDGRLVTGQNPTSAAGVAEAVLGIA